MTKEEAREELRFHFGSTAVRGKKNVVEAMCMAISALEAAERYKWHDLRKDPNDLPDGDCIVLISYVFGYKLEYIVTRYYADNRRFGAWNKPTAWKCIEPLEE